MPILRFAVGTAPFQRDSAVYFVYFPTAQTEGCVVCGRFEVNFAATATFEVDPPEVRASLAWTAVGAVGAPLASLLD